MELTESLEAVRATGADVDLIAPEDDRIQAFNRLDKGDRFDPDKSLDQVDASD